MKFVSNAGPLIALGKLGQLGLLLKLSNEILINLCNQALARARQHSQA